MSTAVAAERDDGDRLGEIGRHRDHRGSLLRAGQDRGGAAVAQHERQLLRREHDVDRVTTALALSAPW